MTDETTPGESLDSGARVEPEVPITPGEPEVPQLAAEDVPQVIAEEPEPVPADAPALDGEPDPAPASPAPAVVPVVPTPTAGLGPAVPSGSRVVVMVSRGPAPVPSTAFVTVPDAVGASQGDALVKLQAAGLPTQVFNDYHPKLPRGEVMAQLPAPGATVPAGSESVLMVSSGPSAVPSVPTALPNVVGLSESDAVSRLQAAGLSPQLVREYSVTFPVGVAIAQIPNSASLISIPKRRSLAWLWVLLALLVVVALGVGAYLYLNRTGVVPVVVGLSQADATAAIEAAGFEVASIETTQTLKASDVGRVVAQSPAANSEARMIDGIGIVVSGGQKLIAVPSVTGKTQSDAENALKNAGLKSTVNKAFSTTVAKGVVISQAPESGQQVPSETSVGIVVSDGAQNISVPNVVNQTEDDAKLIIKANGLAAPRIVSNHSSTYKEGRVAGQFPASGSSIPADTIMGLVVSLGSSDSTNTVLLERFEGQTASAAESRLKGLNLKVVTVQWSGTGKPLNTVIGTLPGSGESVLKNETVIIFASNGR